jgi:hypothetical protein
LKLIDRLLDTLAWDEHEAEKDITSSLWILATIVQNNPQAKQAYLAMNLLPTLLRFSGSQHQSIALKAVYCLTGLLKNNSRAQADFHRLNGYDVVFRQLIDSSNPAALVCKVINMLSQLLVDNPQSIGRYIVRTYRNLVAVLMQIADRYPDDPNVQSLSTGLIRAVIDIDPTVEDYALNKAAIHKRFPEIYK